MLRRRRVSWRAEAWNWRVEDDTSGVLVGLVRKHWQVSGCGSLLAGIRGGMLM